MERVWLPPAERDPLDGDPLNGDPPTERVQLSAVLPAAVLEITSDWLAGLAEPAVALKGKVALSSERVGEIGQSGPVRAQGSLQLSIPLDVCPQAGVGALQLPLGTQTAGGGAASGDG